MGSLYVGLKLGVTVENHIMARLKLSMRESEEKHASLTREACTARARSRHATRYLSSACMRRSDTFSETGK